MSFLTRYLHYLSLTSPNDDGIHIAAEKTEEKANDSSLLPSLTDVLAIKEYLLKKLPIEIVDTVIDFAEYWPHTMVTLRQSSDGNPYKISAGNNENKFLLRSYPLGYIPKEDDRTYLAFQEQGFITSSPTVASHSEGRSQELTLEVLRRWTEERQMRGAHPCRKIVFTIKSHDQGWGGNPDCKGTYRNSYTWFDVGKEEAQISEMARDMKDADEDPQDPYFLVSLNSPEIESSKYPDSSFAICTCHTILPTMVPDIPSTYLSDSNPRGPCKFDHSLLPDSRVLQKNVVAEKNFKEHVIVWSYDDNIDAESRAGNDLEEQGRGRSTADGEFVRNLRPGDMVTIWGKSRFPGWTNFVEELKIDIYWAI